jgi:aldose 1-epimerase
MKSALPLALCIPFMTHAANYTVTRAVEDGVEIYVLRDAARQTEVRVAPAAGNNSYDMRVKGKPVFWSPYRGAGEMAAKPAMLGNPFLWPWANRIDGLSYFVDGKKYHLNPDLGNLRGVQNGTPIHGLLLFARQWRVVRAEAAAGEAALASRFEFARHPELMAQFPFAHAVEMTYRLRDGALEVETVVENQSAGPLPVSLGFHPYFQVNDAPRDEWTVRLAAKERLRLSPRLIPTGEVEPNPYSNPVSLKQTALDDVFTSLVRGADGFARFSVTGKTEAITVEYGPKYTVAVVYAPPGRGFICFEPMSAPTNAFNAAHAGWYKDLQTVAPGQSWREVFRVVASGY